LFRQIDPSDAFGDLLWEVKDLRCDASLRPDVEFEHQKESGNWKDVERLPVRIYEWESFGFFTIDVPRFLRELAVKGTIYNEHLATILKIRESVRRAIESDLANGAAVV
jgi:hypothetical protein